jgi:hypothetical protein
MDHVASKSLTWCASILRLRQLLLSVADHCLRSRNYIFIVGKQSQAFVELSMDCC